MANPAADRALIGHVQASARALGRASVWPNKTAVDVADHNFYELYVLFKLRQALSSSYTVRYVAGSGANRHAFPLGPADKASRPRFEVRDDRGLLFQLCHGTRVRDPFEHEHAPDVSLQTPDAPVDANPSHEHLLLIWDAKYSDREGARISSKDFGEFQMWVDRFRLRSAAQPDLQLSRLLLGNCLITNEKTSTTPDAARRDFNVVEVERFYPGRTPRRSPS